VKTPAVLMEPESAVALRVREIASVLMSAPQANRPALSAQDQRARPEAPR